ncbi:30S ribosomal protein S27e [Candidatus Micrarchaeota archaeon]|nr:30S ribosomal protein S27e [Candidatus Micrarchaeota archaeon]
MPVIPTPKTVFLKVQCPKCKNLQSIFSAPSMKVKCFSCETILAEPSASKGIMKGKIIEAVGKE